MQVMQKENASKEEFRDALKSAVKHLDKLSAEERANWDKLIYYLLAFIYHRRKITEHSELVETVNTTIEDTNHRKEVENMGKTMAQFLMEEGEKIGRAKGLEQGMEQGREQGLIKGKQDDLIRILSMRFNVSKEDIEDKIRSINQVGELNKLFDQAIVAEKFEDIKI
jgi:hypothetical protein